MLMLVPQAQQKTPDQLSGSKAVAHDPAPEPTLPSQVTSCLGDQLRTYYSRLANDPVPEHLIRILEAMDQKERTNGGR